MPNYRKYGLIAWVMMLAMLLINVLAFFLPLIRVNVEEDLFTSKLEYSYSASFADLIFNNIEKEAKFKNVTKEEKEFLQAFSTEENILEYLYYQDYFGKTSISFPPKEVQTFFLIGIFCFVIVAVPIFLGLLKPVKERDVKRMQKILSSPLYHRLPGAQEALKVFSEENTTRHMKIQYANKIYKYSACINWMLLPAFVFAWVNILTLVTLQFTMNPTQDANVSLMGVWIWLLLGVVSFVISLKFSGRIGQEIRNLPLDEPLTPIIGTKNVQIQFAVFNATTEKINDEKSNDEKTSDHNEMYKLELLQKYKSLLDSGAITEEEFQKKKEELLTQ